MTLLAILLLVLVLAITMASRKITRGLEFANLTSIGIQLLFLLVVDLFVLPFSVWWDGLRSLVIPARRPRAATPPCSAAWPALPHGPPGRLPGRHAGRAREVRAIGLTFPDEGP